MPAIRHDVTVQAPLARVWRTLTQFDRWARWHPFISLSGVCEQGATINVSYKMQGKPISAEATVVRCEPQTSFAWGVGLPWIFTMEDQYVLTTQSGSTHVNHIKRYGGMLGPLAWALSRAKIKRGLEREATALASYLRLSKKH